MRALNVLAYELAHTSAQSLQRSAALTKRLWSQPMARVMTGPLAAMIEASAELTERSVGAMLSKPDWRITEAQVGRRMAPVRIHPADRQPFGDLLHFDKGEAARGQPKILLVAPKSGHYATLLRDTVDRLLSQADVYVTDWRNARDIPVSAGKFDVEDYVEYLLNWFDLLGPGLNVIGVCQPAPLALVAAARCEAGGDRPPLATLTLMGGPIDPAAAATEVTQFADRVSIETLRQHSIHRVGHAYEGRGRHVYPGALQLSAFMAMNADRHAKAFHDQWLHLARGDEDKATRHDAFYDEYLAVMDMTAEFYLSTVERIFQKREVAADSFHLRGQRVPIGDLRRTPIMTVEGERDDVAAPGQCVAALDIASRLPQRLKRSHVEPDAGHFAIFSGSRWRGNVAPRILDFIETHKPGKAG